MAIRKFRSMGSGHINKFRLVSGACHLYKYLLRNQFEIFRIMDQLPQQLACFPFTALPMLLAMSINDVSGARLFGFIVQHQPEKLQITPLWGVVANIIGIFHNHAKFVTMLRRLGRWTSTANAKNVSPCFTTGRHSTDLNNSLRCCAPPCSSRRHP